MHFCTSRQERKHELKIEPSRIGRSKGFLASEKRVISLRNRMWLAIWNGADLEWHRWGMAQIEDATDWDVYELSLWMTELERDRAILDIKFRYEWKATVP